MATPPPLNPRPKKIGCTKGCLFVTVIGFFAIILVGVIGNLVSDMKWKNDRAGILNSVGQAVNAGDYERALSLATPHRSRNDSDLNALVVKAEGLKRQAAEKARNEQIAALVADIKVTQGEERENKLQRLIALAPNTNEFPDELPAIREKIRQREGETRAKAEAEHQAAPIVEIKKIAGKTAKEVGRVLSVPSQTETVKHGIKRFYMKRAIEVIFINGKADWITVTPSKKTPFTKESLGDLGLPVKEPTFSNQHILKWEPYDNYRSISIFPGPNGIDYIYIMTKTK